MEELNSGESNEEFVPAPEPPVDRELRLKLNQQEMIAKTVKKIAFYGAIVAVVWIYFGNRTTEPVTD